LIVKVIHRTCAHGTVPVLKSGQPWGETGDARSFAPVFCVG
jgi:hypothetical protein